MATERASFALVVISQRIFLVLFSLLLALCSLDHRLEVSARGVFRLRHGNLSSPETRFGKSPPVGDVEEAALDALSWRQWDDGVEDEKKGEEAESRRSGLSRDGGTGPNARPPSEPVGLREDVDGSQSVSVRRSAADRIEEFYRFAAIESIRNRSVTSEDRSVKLRNTSKDGEAGSAHYTLRQCRCKASWSHNGGNYKFCQITADSKGRPWCFTMPGCARARPAKPEKGKAAPWDFCPSSTPPRCPGDVPSDAVYWKMKRAPQSHHNLCQYSQSCTMQISNLERVRIIRGALEKTKNLLQSKGVPYILYGGSAIGQHRCNDVLPWDVDCDVVIHTSHVGMLIHGPIDARYTLIRKSKVIPFAVVDTQNGFYCDVFKMDMPPGGSQMLVAWPWGGTYCPQFPESGSKCIAYPLTAAYPYSSCPMSGQTYTCARDQYRFLSAEYGAGVSEPDVAVLG